MKKALASVFVIVFAGLLCTSMLTVAGTGPSAKRFALQSHYAYYGSY